MQGGATSLELRKEVMVHIRPFLLKGVNHLISILGGRVVIQWRVGQAMKNTRRAGGRVMRAMTPTGLRGLMASAVGGWM